jgi:hypothetical protein
VSNTRDVAREFPSEEVLATSSKRTVYRSTDSRSGASVVVKMIPAGPSVSEVRKHRFLRSMDAVKSLQLNGLPQIVAHGFAPDGDAFIVMHFVSGKPLGEFRKSSPDTLLKILARVADTLEIASRSGVFHGNLEPNNIFVEEGAGGNQVRLLGLGTALLSDRSRAGEDDEPAKSPSRLEPPERASARGEIGAEEWRLDLQSFAAMAIDLLCGSSEGEVGRRPSVSLPDDVCQQLAEPEVLIHALQVALMCDSGQRSPDWADLRRGLTLKNPSTVDMESSGQLRLDKTVRIPLDRLPRPLMGAAAPVPAGATHAYGVKSPPVACGDAFEVEQGSILNIDAPGVLENDSDPGGEPLASTLISGPKHGTLALKSDGSFAYSPDSGFDGTDSFSYKASNGTQSSNEATVTITVSKIKSPPQAVDDSYTTGQNQSLRVPQPGVLANDVDDNSLPLKAIAVTLPTQGTLRLSSDGSFVYVPNPDFHGVDTFAYRASNGLTASRPATVKITVLRAEKQPGARADEITRPRGRVVEGAGKAAAPPSMELKPGTRLPSRLTPPPLPKPPLARVTPPPMKGAPSAVPAPPPLRSSPPPPPPGSSDVSLTPPPLPISKDVPSPPPLPGPLFSELALGRPLILALAGIAAVVVALVLLVVLWPDPAIEHDETVAPPVIQPTRSPTRTPMPTVTPTAEIHTHLVAAESALILGDVNLAKAELAAITAAEVEAFSEEEAGLYEHLVAAIEGGQREQAIEDLRAGLSRSNLGMIRRGLSGLSGVVRQEIAATPGLASEIDRGRRALKLYSDMERARRDGNSVGLLESSTAMVRLLPGLNVAAEWREEAATLLEITAEGMAAEGQYLRAIAALEPISAHWPDRSGLSERLDRYRRMQDQAAQNAAAVEAYNAVVASALGRGEAGYPDEGLKMLESQTAPPQAEARRREAIRTLEAKLARLDGAAPTIALAPNTDFTLRKNQPLVVQVRVDDDYRVHEVTVKIRVEGSQQFQDWSFLTIADTMYTVEIDPATHQNGLVEMVFEARDLSGHVTQLGTPSQPLAFDRKGLFKRIVGN